LESLTVVDSSVFAGLESHLHVDRVIIGFERVMVNFEL
jgi:hypothetical protein